MAILTIACPLMGKTPLFWKDISKENIALQGKAAIQTTTSRLMEVDLNSLAMLLLSAPFEGSPDTPLLLGIPMPDGNTSHFRIVETPVIPSALKQKYPGINTWAGQGVENPSATINLDITRWGFHAMILSPDGDVYIDPFNQQTKSIYQVYFKSAAVNKASRSVCGFNSEDSGNVIAAQNIRRDVQQNGGGLTVLRSEGSTLRRYEAAIACTGEYAGYHGGTVPGALSAIVTTLNRVTGVYEKELAVRLVLVPNKLQKARGVTGSMAPIGDPFDIDYVAHEMGHQFGGNHTFNGTTGACTGNGNSATAFEPGSGTTIMAYAGICLPQNIQANSDAYFHTANFDEIIDYITLSTGATCALSTPTGNTPPVINSIGTDHVIPYQTPFVLEGAATDPDGDTVTYCWEQYDIGNAGAPTNPTGNAPLFRSFNPTTNPKRYFPKLSAIVANSASIGELLPTYARNMKFRLTARDGRVNGGGVTYEEVLVNLQVINTGAPFLVTSPNTSITWVAGTQENITWNVVGTDIAPINSPNVDVFLSLDGGFTYPITLATAVPNSGVATVTVPAVSTTQARVMVKGAANVFFDISNVNFTITNPQGVFENASLDAIRLFPNPSGNFTHFSMAGKYRGDVSLNIFDAKGKLVYTQNLVKAGDGLLYQLDLSSFSAGVYTVRAASAMGNSYEKLVIE
ncbi:MAG: T9SS type A sorting domain-containing protein [Bacteroidetes bacterium]|nr:T9SS type A sorting domain-containing protein [Bacteroidota bacterium]